MFGRKKSRSKEILIQKNFSSKFSAQKDLIQKILVQEIFGSKVILSKIDCAQQHIRLQDVNLGDVKKISCLVKKSVWFGIWFNI